MQKEVPDYWLDTVGCGSPWEIPRPNIRYPINFFGKATPGGGWEPEETVFAQAYDTPIPGFGTTNCGNLRLWEAFPMHEIDLQAFNDGDYIKVRCVRACVEIASRVMEVVLVSFVGSGGCITGVSARMHVQADGKLEAVTRR